MYIYITEGKLRKHVSKVLSICFRFVLVANPFYHLLQSECRRKTWSALERAQLLVSQVSSCSALSSMNSAQRSHMLTISRTSLFIHSSHSTSFKSCHIQLDLPKTTGTVSLPDKVPVGVVVLNLGDMRGVKIFVQIDEAQAQEEARRFFFGKKDNFLHLKRNI